MSNVNWRRTQLTRDLIRCELCGNKADTVHFLTEGGYPHGEGADAQIDAVFKFVAHDAGPYCVELDRWFKPDGQFPEHVGEKTWGAAALASLQTRFDAILRGAAERDRT